MSNKSKYLKISLILNFIFILIIILLSYKYVQKSIDRTFLDKDIEIVMFGNSITAWGEWETLLDRNDLLTSGFPGYTSSHLKLLIANNVIKYNPVICFIMVGINDIQLGIPMHLIKSNYISMLEDLKKNRITPVVESVLYAVDNPEINNEVDSLNRFLIDYCNTNNIDYLDINTKLSTSNGLKPEYSTDGIHLNKKAYDIWAQEIKRFLNSIEHN
jgi:lysophospholipase L1-like esterase